jgi:thiol peroxidase
MLLDVFRANDVKARWVMARPGAVTFKGTPLTLVGNAVRVGQAAPDFSLHRFVDGGLKAVRLRDLAGKPVIISVVPSLDTGVCQKQTKEFNEKLAGLGDRVHAVTVSLDLPFAQNRFCGAENITNLMSLSDYQERRFGQDWGMLIDELKILARGVFVLDAQGKVVYTELVPEVTQEPNYGAALDALRKLAT